MSVIGKFVTEVTKHAKKLVEAVAKGEKDKAEEYNRKLKVAYETGVAVSLVTPAVFAEFQKEQARRSDANLEGKEAKRDVTKEAIEEWLKRKISNIVVKEIDQSIYRKREGWIIKGRIKLFNNAMHGDDIPVKEAVGILERVLAEFTTNPQYFFVKIEFFPEVRDFLNGKFNEFTYDDIYISGRKKLMPYELQEIKDLDEPDNPMAMPLFLAADKLSIFPPEDQNIWAETVKFLHGKGADLKDTFAQIIHKARGVPLKLINLPEWIKKLELKIDFATKKYVVGLLINKIDGLFKPDNLNDKKYVAWMGILRQMAADWNIFEWDQELLQKLKPGFKKELSGMFQELLDQNLRAKEGIGDMAAASSSVVAEVVIPEPVQQPLPAAIASVSRPTGAAAESKSVKASAEALKNLKSNKTPLNVGAKVQKTDEEDGMEMMPLGSFVKMPQTTP